MNLCQAEMVPALLQVLAVRETVVVAVKAVLEAKERAENLVVVEVIVNFFIFFILYLYARNLFLDRTLTPYIQHSFSGHYYNILFRASLAL